MAATRSLAISPIASKTEAGSSWSPGSVTDGAVLSWPLSPLSACNLNAVRLVFPGFCSSRFSACVRAGAFNKINKMILLKSTLLLALSYVRAQRQHSLNVLKGHCGRSTLMDGSRCWGGSPKKGSTMVCQNPRAWSAAAGASMSSMEYLINFLTSSCTQLQRSSIHYMPHHDMSMTLALYI